MISTTQPLAPWLQVIASVPIAVWLLAIGILFVVFRVLQLRIRQQSQPPPEQAAAHLAELHAALQRFARENSGRLPRTLAEFGFPHAGNVVYRPASFARADEKILIAHDATPTTSVLEFPQLRPARHVLFWSGRVRLVSESAFEKLVAADDAFRDKIGATEPQRVTDLD